MSSQIHSRAENTNKKHVPASMADTSLTLSAKKLAGSAHCLNCNTELQGPFCYYCGQPDRNFMRFFPALLRDLMEDVLDFDSRFMRTLKPLMFRPGRLTKDFMSGRRFRYTPPMRLYIFSSIVFFLLAALFSSDLVVINSSKETSNEAGIVHFSAQTEEEMQQVEETLSGLPSELRDKIVSDPVGSKSGVENTEPDMFSPDEFQLNGQPWNRETNPIAIPFLPQWINDRLNDEVENSPKKAKQINDNPNLFIDKVLDILPATMFVLLPIVALIFKFWYLFAKRYYVEHLIFSLHNHAFIFVCLTLLLLLNEAGDMFGNRGMTELSIVMNWLMIAIWTWIPIYLLVSLRVVYQQNWLMTTLKYIAISISYITLLGLLTTAVALASFILL